MMSSNVSDNQQVNHLLKYVLSRNVINIFKKMSKIDNKNLLKITTNEHKNQLESQVKRLRKIISQQKLQSNFQVDNQYVLLAVINYMKALKDFQQTVPGQQSKTNSILNNSSLSENEETRESIIIRRVQNALSEIQKDESQIRKFMNEQVLNREQIDYPSCYEFFMTHFNHLKRNKGGKILTQRMYIFEIIIYFLGKIIKGGQTDNENEYEYEFQQYQNDQNDHSQNNYSQYQSINYGIVNKWKNLSSNSLYHKLIQLSSICQQIPQLQAFNRTLQFTQLQNQQRIIFFKIVNVIISLHHRIHFLSRNQPDVVKQCQQLLQQINITNNRCQKFIFMYQEEEGKQLLPISFSRADSKSKGYFNQSLKDLKGHLIRMSQIITSQYISHTSNFNKIHGIIELVELFMKVISGDLESIIQWNRIIQNLNQSKDKRLISVEQYKIIMVLQQCLQIQNSKLEEVMNRQPKSTARTNQQLQGQVNKLIEDYERLKNQNRRINQSLNNYIRINEQLQLDVNQRDDMIENLSMIRITLQKKLASKDDLQQKSKKQEHETQKYLQSSLLLKEQLKISQAQRQRLTQLLQIERQKNSKQYELSTKLRGQKQKLQAQIQQLKQKIDNLKVQHLRNQSRLTKNINDLGNQKHLLQSQLQTTDINNARLIQRLQANQKKLTQYSRLVMARFEGKPQRKDSQSKIIDDLQQKLDDRQKQIQKLKRQITSLKRQQQKIYIEQDNFIKQNHWLKQQNEQLKYKKQASEQYYPQSNEELQATRKQNIRMHKRIQELYQQRRQYQARYKTQTNSKENIERIGWLQKQLQNLKSKTLQQERLLISNQNLFKRQLNYGNDTIKRQSDQIIKKDSIQSQLKAKISQLQSQLSKQRQQMAIDKQNSNKFQLNQHEQIIDKQKIIQLKLREQAKNLQKELQNKIEIQIKLNFQIQKLSKEINRMKFQLDRYLKELTEKQIIIKNQQDKNYNHLKMIREMEAEENVRIQQESFKNSPESINTPFKDQKYTKGRQSSILSKRHEHESENSPSERNHSGYKSNVKYDIYFNLKEYQRLYKEYNDYKLLVASKVEGLQNMQNAINQLTHSKRSLEEHLHVLQDQKSKVEQTLHSCQAQLKQIPLLREKVRQLTQKNNQLMRILNSGGDETIKLKKEIESLKLSLLKLEEICNSNKAQKMSIQSKLNYIQQENRRLNHHNEQLKTSFTQFELKINQLTRQLKGQHNNQLLAQIQLRLQQQKQKNNFFQRQNNRLLKEMAILEQKIRSSGLHGNANLNYYLQKIKYLQDALQAVSDELADSKQALKIVHYNHKLQQGSVNNKEGNNDQILERYKIQNTNMMFELQRYRSIQIEWAKKQRLYLTELQKMTQQNLSLKDSMNRNNKLITTSLNRQVTYNKNTYDNLQRKQSFKGSRQGNSKDINVQLQNVLQFVYRILIIFSQIQYNSAEGSKIRLQLQKISDNSSGGIFFTTLQEYTIHILENNAIEEYKRELRKKAQQLLSIKEKLDELITKQIEQEENMLNRPQIHRSNRKSLAYHEYHQANI